MTQINLGGLQSRGRHEAMTAFIAFICLASGGGGEEAEPKSNPRKLSCYFFLSSNSEQLLEHTALVSRENRT